VDTNRHTTDQTARRTALLLLAGVGTGIGLVWGPARVGLAQAPNYRPQAARLAAPQALEPADVAARGAPTDAAGPGAPPPPAAGTMPESWGRAFPADPPAVRPDSYPPYRPPAADGGGVWGGVKGFFTDSTRVVKSAFGIRPPEPPPQPRIGQVTPPYVPPPVRQAVPPQPPAASAGGPTRPADWDRRGPQTLPVQGTSPGGAPVYAGVPAYRWYGWGTVTPGMNPYAPDGEYPKGSANWYAQTGATPGAFPVPVANPFRPPPGSDPPVYVRATTAPPPPVSPPPPRLDPPPLPRPIAQTPPPSQYALPAPPDPPPLPVSHSVPAAPVPPPARPVPVGVPAAPVVPPGLPESRWQTAPPAPAPTPIIPVMRSLSQTSAVEPGWGPAGGGTVLVARGQEPADDPDAKVVGRIRAACEGLVTGVTVERAGPNRLVVSFSATTETLAEIAARAVSAIPDLRPVAVDFKARITCR